MDTDSKRILVVDDIEDNRYTLGLLLELDGFTDVAFAEDGAAALAALEGGAFDLVLLDVMMPNVNGYEVLEALKASGRLGEPPVIMITALDEMESAVRCIELGAVDYLAKPFEPTILKARIRSTLERKALSDEVRAHRDRMEAELEEARELQVSLCPQAPPGLADGLSVDVRGLMVPAREVGGDLYDYFSLGPGRLCLVVADVAGKGAPAALYSARTHDLVRLCAEAELGRDGAEPARIVSAVNRVLSESNPSMTFVTLVVAVLETASGEVRYCNAGHDDPYLLSPSRGVQSIEGAKGPPVGIAAATRYTSEGLRLEPGETLFLYTDGLTEAMSGEGKLFSPERVAGALRDLTGAGPEAVLEGVKAALDAFVGDAPAADDLTLLALRLG